MEMDGGIGLRLELCSGSGGGRREESPRAAASGRGPRRARVLVMDDDRMVRETMRRQLAILGFEVVLTVEGQEAVGAFQQARQDGQPFDIVILDKMVPRGWGGEETLLELLRLDPDVKALLCSGSLTCAPAEYRRKGFSGVLGKPYALGDLRGLVEAVLPPGIDL